jgi:1-acyl-sn-glycerol-3-phosphate acyltransferase
VVTNLRLTLYNTPLIRHIVKLGAWIGLRISGWKVTGSIPKEKKYVIIAVPHETNWDFPITLAMAFILGFKIFWMGKSSLFKWPFGAVMRWLGGIPINRDKKSNTVSQTIEAFRQARELVVVIPPEGTRSNVTSWRTGFYHIAVGAGVPIVLGYIDHANKTGGLGPVFYPTGDLNSDLPKIQAFYQKQLGIKFN